MQIASTGWRGALTAAGLLLAGLGALDTLAAAENWIVNGDFESDQPVLWKGGVLDRNTAHSGRGSLRLDEPADRSSVGARYEKPVEPKQTDPETILAAFWMRLDAKRQTGAIRGGMTFRVEMADGTSMAWYGPFELEPGQMGSWVYCEGRWKPKAPVVAIRPSVYLRGCEGSIWVDDLYLGPARSLPSVARKTVPLAITGTSGRFTDWPRVEFLDFRPDAHVFHLAGKNETNLALTCVIDVLRPAPAYLTSAGGSQYWTLYCPERAELAQIYTDERLDLSKPGKQTAPVRMSGFSSGGSDLAPGGYVFVTEGHKSYYVYGTEKRAASAAKDPKTVRKTKYWDTVKVDLLSRHLGASGVVAPFSLADLGSHSLAVSACAEGDAVIVEPTLVDARKNRVPLYGLKLQAGGQSQAIAPEIDAEGVPTGRYRARLSGPKADSIRVSGKVRLATPQGLKEEALDRTVALGRPPAAVAARALPKLDLRGWGTPSYELSAKASHGPQSMARLVADAKAAGVSRLFVHARSSRETLYPSRVALAATVGEWDVLKRAVAEGKRQGVGIYAAYILGIAQEADLEAHPDWAAWDKDGKPNGWYCYTNPEVHAFHAALVAEIVSLYQVEGVSLDFCRPGGGCFCPRCQKAFEARCGKRLTGEMDPYDPDWQAWQRNSITEYLRKLREAVRKARPNAQFSGYVWARFAPDKDRGGQDWPRWLKEGIMDWVAVGQYTPSTPWFRAECQSLRTIAQRELGGDMRRICPLLGVSYIQGANPSHAAADAVIDRHLQAAREAGLTAAGYFPFFSIRTHLETSASHAKTLAREP